MITAVLFVAAVLFAVGLESVQIWKAEERRAHAVFYAAVNLGWVYTLVFHAREYFELLL